MDQLPYLNKVLKLIAFLLKAICMTFSSLNLKLCSPKNKLLLCNDNERHNRTICITLCLTRCYAIKRREVRQLPPDSLHTSWQSSTLPYGPETRDREGRWGKLVNPAECTSGCLSKHALYFDPNRTSGDCCSSFFLLFLTSYSQPWGKENCMPKLIHH